MPATLKGIQSLKKGTINAVDDDDLADLLESLGLLEELDQARLVCVNCGDIITRESLQAIIPYGTTIRVVCWKPECIQMAVQEKAA